MCTALRKCALIMFAPALDWKKDTEWIAHHAHSDVKHYAA